jgi:hypothetical protein
MYTMSVTVAEDFKATEKPLVTFFTLANSQRVTDIDYQEIIGTGGTSWTQGQVRDVANKILSEASVKLEFEDHRNADAAFIMSLAKLSSSLKRPRNEEMMQALVAETDRSKSMKILKSFPRATLETLAIDLAQSVRAHELDCFEEEASDEEYEHNSDDDEDDDEEYKSDLD